MLIINETETKWCLGIDTSNYSTSVAGCIIPQLNYDKLIDNADGLISLDILAKLNQIPAHFSARIPITTAPKEKMVRPNEVVIIHTLAISELIDDIMKKYGYPPSAVVVSDKMSERDTSQICFNVGYSVGKSIAAALRLPFYTVSHQEAHILSAIMGCKQLELLRTPHYAFHISGGATELLYVTPKLTAGLDLKFLGSTCEINAGQLVDRCGVKMGLSFPCGTEFEELALTSSHSLEINEFRAAKSINLTVLENKYSEMLGYKPRSEISSWLLRSLSNGLIALGIAGMDNFETKVLLTGEVSAIGMVKDALGERFKTIEAGSQYVTDNAVGVAFYGAMRMM